MYVENLLKSFQSLTQKALQVDRSQRLLDKITLNFETKCVPTNLISSNQKNFFKMAFENETLKKS